MVVSITVVTPTLNAARYLPDCLTSVATQNYPRLEHIVVDGGSTDETATIAAGAIWLSAPGSNQSQAINAGLHAARGEVLAWLNADDLYAESALQTVGDRFAADVELDVLYGDCDVVDESGALLWHERPGDYDFERLLRRGNYLAQPAVFLRRRVLERVGYLDESFEYGMDYELWLRLRTCKVAYVPQVLALFRWHQRSKTATSQLGNWRELLRAVRRHGGGWTLPLAWSFSRMLLTVARQRVAARLH